MTISPRSKPAKTREQIPPGSRRSEGDDHAIRRSHSRKLHSCRGWHHDGQRRKAGAKPATIVSARIDRQDSDHIRSYDACTSILAVCDGVFRPACWHRSYANCPVGCTSGLTWRIFEEFHLGYQLSLNRTRIARCGDAQLVAGMRT